MKAITRAEVSMAIGEVVVVGSLNGSIYYGLANRRVQSMVESDLEAVEAAVLAFYEEYRVLPTMYPDYFDFRYGLEGDVKNNEIMNALQALDAAGNIEHAVNSRQIVYIRIPKAAKSSQA